MNAQEHKDYIENLDNAILTKIISTRKEKGISQTELAKLLGTSQTNYANIEKSKIRLNVTTMLILFKYLDIKNPFTTEEITEQNPVPTNEELKEPKETELVALNPTDIIKIFSSIAETNKEILNSNKEISEMLKTLINK